MASQVQLVSPSRGKAHSWQWVRSGLLCSSQTWQTQRRAATSERSSKGERRGRRLRAQAARRHATATVHRAELLAGEEATPLAKAPVVAAAAATWAAAWAGSRITMAAAKVAREHAATVLHVSKEKK